MVGWSLVVLVHETYLLNGLAYSTPELLSTLRSSGIDRDEYGRITSIERKVLFGTEEGVRGKLEEAGCYTKINRHGPHRKR